MMDVSMLSIPTIKNSIKNSLRIYGTFGTAGYTLLVYDYFLSLNDEISYIWTSPWTVVKVMFLVNRYGNLVGQTYIRLEEAGILAHDSRTFCVTFGLITSYFLVLSSESIHILVLMRASAIWGTRKRVTQIFIMAYTAYILVLMGGATHGIIDNNEEHFRHLHQIKVCVWAIPKYMWLIHVGSCTLDTLVFVLTMRSLWKYTREFQHLYPSGLLHILVRDAGYLCQTDNPQDPRYFLAKAYVTGQRLVLNLKGLKTRSYATRDLSLEVDRQLEAFAETDCPIALDDVGDLESGREASDSGNSSHD
ncbi:hypothetical protein K503DRAFT_748599 [Rhizopogon vinicolor AM-OR11-026]|uniref:DUF6533 domain-containing protein n=1 Tax=Rhizopogon vinicolor AM-OR11-026 TaxID=1314800 RepID=A0A1B7MLR2_9AGAM|nr:hypothetical protein K503DRAFT_748599 [Rhizopogon vinicolor AM-OR11-026]